MKKLTTAVIMAGGQGTRLASITGPLPKAMVNIHGTQAMYNGQAKDTILEHQMKVLSENGITNFILVVGNKKEYIQNAFTNETINQLIPGRNITISYFEEGTPLGTGGSFCFKELRDMIPQDDFLFTYADVLFDVNVKKMFEAHVRDNSDATVVISPCSEPDDRPLCVCGKGSNEVISIIPKQGKGDGPRSGFFPNTPKNGIMIVNKSLFAGLPSEPTILDMEADILSKAIYSSSYKVTAWNTPCYLKDIGTVDRFYEGVEDLAKGIPQQKNPDKSPQHCVIYRESDLIQIDGEGNAILDTKLARSIEIANKAGVITVLDKDSEVLDAHPRADWAVDTMLARDGNGAFLNARFNDGQTEELVDIMTEWNIPREQAHEIVLTEPKGCILTNLGTREQEVFSGVVGATYAVVEEFVSQVEDSAQ